MYGLYMFARPKRGRPTPGFSIVIRSVGLLLVHFYIRLLRSKFNPYTFIEGQKDKVTKGQRDKGTKGQRDKGTNGQWDKGTKGQRDVSTKGQKALYIKFTFLGNHFKW